MKRTIDQFTPVEFQAGRLLLGLTVAGLAAKTGIGEETLRRVESGVATRLSTRHALVKYLWREGIRFTDRPDEVMASAEFSQTGLARYAPTEKVRGRFHGSRLEQACRRLQISLPALSEIVQVSLPTLVRMTSAKDLQSFPSLEFYRVVRALELRGYCFQRKSPDGRGDDFLRIVNSPHQIR